MVPNGNFEQKDFHWVYLKKSLHTNTKIPTLFENPFFYYPNYLIWYKNEMIKYNTTWKKDPNCKKYKEDLNKQIEPNCICFYRYDENNEIVKTSIDTTNNYYKPLYGNYYIHSIGSYKKNLFQVKLNKNLIKDSLYYIEFNYKIPRNYFNDGDNFLLKGDLGVLFTNTDFSLQKNLDILFSSNYRAKPQILITNLNKEISNGWIKFSLVFKASRNAQYLIIGNHKPFHKQKLEGFEYYVMVTYNIDDILLMPYNNIFNAKNLKKGDIIELENVYFSSGKSELLNKSNTTLNKLLNLMKNSSIKILIKGHTDNIGNEMQNITLSKNRAKSIVDFLVLKGINSNRISYEGYGSSLPVATNNTERGKQQNRRVEIEIL